MNEQVVEVLRAELARVSYERNEAQAEIERLRYDLGLERHSNERRREVESNVTAAMVEWEKRWRSTARENERLRGLLQEVADCGASYKAANYDEVQIPHELDAAIREALGDDRPRR